MLNLRSFHLGFILLAIIGADLFGAWAVRYYIQQKDVAILTIGIVAVLGGLGLVWYAVRLVRSFDRAEIR